MSQGIPFRYWSTEVDESGNKFYTIKASHDQDLRIIVHLEVSNLWVSMKNHHSVISDGKITSYAYKCDQEVYPKEVDLALKMFLKHDLQGYTPKSFGCKSNFMIIRLENGLRCVCKYPEILTKWQLFKDVEEECPILPFYYRTVPRCKVVTVRYENEEGELVLDTLEGKDAFTFQMYYEMLQACPYNPVKRGFKYEFGTWKVPVELTK